MPRTENVWTLARLELADAVRSRWLAFTCVAYAVVFGVFVWLGLHESTILGFTGLSRVILNVSNAVVLAVPLIALVATSQSVVRARGTGLMEMLFTQPCRRGEWFAALIGSRAVVLVGPLLVLLGLAGVLGLVQERDINVLLSAWQSFAVSAALAWAFLGLGLLISTVARTAERAVVYAVLLWLVTSALHDFALIGVLLQWRLPPAAVFVLAALNPVEAARLAILSGVDPDLSILGPVGFWLANTLGPRGTLTIGTLWPALVGSGALLVAWWRLRRSDAVG